MVRLLCCRKPSDGVDMIAGTDVLNPFCFPGFSLADERELYVKAGFSPMEALRTATANPARFLGPENDLGTVESGKTSRSGSPRGQSP